MSLTKDVIFNVQLETMAKGCLDKLAKMYEQPSASNKVHLMKKLFNLKMKEDESFSVHMNKFNSVVSQLTSVSIALDDEVKALLLLS